MAVLLALPATGEAQGVVYAQLPPSPSLGLVQDPQTGQWIDPLAPYDSQGLRLWGEVDSSVSHNLVFSGEVAYTFTSGSDFSIDPMGTNKALGGYLDDFGATGAYPLSSGALIGPDTGTTYTWLGHDPLLGGLLLAVARGSGVIGSPILFTGPFAGTASAYIGLEFYVDGEAYYGWVRVGAPASINGGWIYNYAYSTIPNAPIVAGAGLVIPLAPVQIVRPGNLRLTWQSEAGQAYQVQFKDQLDAPGWTNTDLTIVAAATNTVADVPIVGAARFYRVIQVP